MSVVPHGFLCIMAFTLFLNVYLLRKSQEAAPPRARPYNSKKATQNNCQNLSLSLISGDFPDFNSQNVFEVLKVHPVKQAFE